MITTIVLDYSDLYKITKIIIPQSQYDYTSSLNLNQLIILTCLQGSFTINGEIINQTEQYQIDHPTTFTLSCETEGGCIILETIISIDFTTRDLRSFNFQTTGEMDRQFECKYC
jgi:hypothetical protein